MRFLSWIFLALTVAAVVLDWLARKVADGEAGDMVLRPLDEAWNGLHSTSLEKFQSLVEQYVSAGFWETVFQPLLSFPAALSFGVAFLFFRVIGSLMRRPKRYYNVDPV